MSREETKREVDVAVIGAGTAGLAAYRTLKEAGREVVLIDHGPLGTMCARTGCMPSKAMLRAAHRWATARAVAGFDADTGDVAREQLWAGVRAMRDRMAGSAATKTRESVGDDLVAGTARFVGPDVLDVEGRRVRARAFVVATGSRPVISPPFDALGERVLTTDSLFDLERLPASMGVVGLGNVGIEIGVALARFGVRVEGFDTAQRPGGIRDPEVGRHAIERLSTELAMSLGTKAEVSESEDGLAIACGGRMVHVDRVLVALGRRPNLESLHLDAAGVRWSQDEEAPIDARSLRLGDAPIFVAGDAASDRPLQHEAADEGAIAAHEASALIDGARCEPAARRVPLSIVFTDPDLCQVGLRFDEVDARDAVVATATGEGNGRSTLAGEPGNVVRLYVARRDRIVLGASVFATDGEHLAHLIALAVGRRIRVDDLLAMPFYHPTLEELLEAALEDAVRRLDEGR